MVWSVLSPLIVCLLFWRLLSPLLLSLRLAVLCVVLGLLGVFYGWASPDFKALQRYWLQKYYPEKIQSLRKAIRTPQEAIAVLEAQLQSRSHDAEAWFLLGRLKRETQDTQGAIEAMSQALQEDPSNVSIRYALAELRLLTHHFKDAWAEQTLEALLREHPKHPQILSLKGLVAYEQGHRRQALDHFEQALEGLDPNAPEAQTLLALVRKIQKEGSAP